MERVLPWPGGERRTVVIVAASGVEEPGFDEAIARIQIALAETARSADALSRVNDRLAARGVEVRVLGETVAALYIEVRLVRSE